MRKAWFCVLMFCLLGSVAWGDTLRVLSYQTYPFFYQKDGQPAGFEYELLRTFAQGRGMKIEVRWIEVWEEILPLLEQGQGDVVAACMTITPERKKSFDFSESYFPVRIVLVEPRGKKSSSPEELAGATLATIKGTTYERTLRNKVPQPEFIYAESEQKLFELVSEGKARALAVDSPVAIVLLHQFDNLQFGVPLSEEQNYGFALPRGSRLKSGLNAHIRQLKISGLYFRMLERYFGAQAVEAIQLKGN